MRLTNGVSVRVGASVKRGRLSISGHSHMFKTPSAPPEHSTSPLGSAAAHSALLLCVANVTIRMIVASVLCIAGGAVAS